MGLKAFRDGASSFASKILLTILAISFIGWGIGDYVTGGVNSTAIEVNGDKISVQELGREFELRVQTVQQRIKQTITPEIAAMLNIGQQSINGLIREKLLQQAAANLELRVSDKTVRKIIVNTPEFQDENKQFNNLIYKSALRSNGYTREGYEQILRQRLTRNALNGLFVSNFSNEETINRMLNAEKELINIKILTLNNNDITTPQNISDEEVKQYFEANRNRYMSAETRDFDVLSLTASDLAKTITVGDVELQAEYEAHQNDYHIPEMRKASHILIKDATKADKILALAKVNPDNFAELAKQHSKDNFTAQKGGDLGFFNREDMEKNFSETAYSLNVGEISDVVKSAFGYHIIKLEKIREGRTLTFAEAKADLEKNLQLSLAEEAYFELQATVADNIAGGGTLAEISKELSLPLDSYSNIKRDDNSKGLLFLDSILPVAFDAFQDEISEPIELQNQSGMLFVQVKNIKLSSELSFTESAQNALKNLRHQKTTEALKAQSEKLLASRKTGKNLDEVARINGLSRNLQTVENISRYGKNAPQWLQNKYLIDLFNVKKGSNVAKLIPTNNGVALVAVTKRHQGEITDDDKLQMVNAMQAQLSYNLVEQFIQGMMDNADVEVNNPLIYRALGERGFFAKDKIKEVN